MRHNFMGSDSCKNKAKEISAQDTSNTYVGLAVRQLVKFAKDIELSTIYAKNFAGMLIFPTAGRTTK